MIKKYFIQVIGKDGASVFIPVEKIAKIKSSNIDDDFRKQLADKSAKIVTDIYMDNGNSIRLLGEEAEYFLKAIEQFTA